MNLANPHRVGSVCSRTKNTSLFGLWERPWDCDFIVPLKSQLHKPFITKTVTMWCGVRSDTSSIQSVSIGLLLHMGQRALAQKSPRLVRSVAGDRLRSRHFSNRSPTSSCRRFTKSMNAMVKPSLVVIMQQLQEDDPVHIFYSRWLHPKKKFRELYLPWPSIALYFWD